MSNPGVTVEIFDTTLRDGAQSLPEVNQFPAGTKPNIATHIAALGVGVIEAGFPRTPGDGLEVRDVAELVGNTHFQTAVWQNGEQTKTESRAPVIAGLCRTTREDIEAGWDAVKPAINPRIHTFISTDTEHMAAKFPGKIPSQVLAMGIDAVKYAGIIMDGRHSGGHSSGKGSGKGTVEFSAEAATTTDTDFLERVVKSMIDHGADIINLPGTLDKRSPMWMLRFYARALEWIASTNPDVVLSAHNHHDLGLSTASSLMLVQAAADHAKKTDREVKIQVETTICGVGERAGNTDVFPLVAGLFEFSTEMPVPITWRFNPGNAYAVARAVMAYGGMEVDRQNPVVGDDIITHRSGIHSDGVLKGGFAIYTWQDPRFWGHPQEARFEEGKYQGKAGRLAATSNT